MVNLFLVGSVWKTILFLRVPIFVVRLIYLICYNFRLDFWLYFLSRFSSWCNWIGLLDFVSSWENFNFIESGFLEDVDYSVHNFLITFAIELFSTWFSLLVQFWEYGNDFFIISLLITDYPFRIDFLQLKTILTNLNQFLEDNGFQL